MDAKNYGKEGKDSSRQEEPLKINLVTKKTYNTTSKKTPERGMNRNRHNG